MEYKFVKMSRLIFYFSIVFIIGCGYFDDDEIVFEKTIVGNFKVSRQGNSNSFTLTFLENPQVSEGLIEDCRRIFYDSTNENIYVESFFNKYNFAYHKVEILNANSESIIGAYKKSAITLAKFDLLTSKLPVVFDVDESPISAK